MKRKMPDRQFQRSRNTTSSRRSQRAETETVKRQKEEKQKRLGMQRKSLVLQIDSIFQQDSTKVFASYTFETECWKATRHEVWSF
jgi:hypothetical protein